MGNLYRHFTETIKETNNYLLDIFGTDPVLIKYGADLRCGDKRIEVKACTRWIRDNGAFNERRRGRFHFQHPLKCDYVLFILIDEDAESKVPYQFKLMKISDVDYLLKLKNHKFRSIRWNKIFV